MSKKSSSARSMTGFGSARSEAKAVSIEVEIKGVNSRYLDLTTKLPKVYLPFEGNLKEQVQKHVRRGRVEAVVRRTGKTSDSYRFSLNEDLFLSVLKCHESALKRGKVELSSTDRATLAMRVLDKREILDISEESNVASSEEILFRRVFEKALLNFDKSRLKEGQTIVLELKRRLKQLDGIVAKVRTDSKKAVNTYKARLQKKIKDLEGMTDIDSGRFHTELFLALERIDINEELSRLAGHLEQCLKALENGGEIGRRLDFLCQELLRELNTIGSKAQNHVIQSLVVDGKLEVEKLKELVQNVE